MLRFGQIVKGLPMGELVTNEVYDEECQIRNLQVIEALKSIWTVTDPGGGQVPLELALYPYKFRGLHQF